MARKDQPETVLALDRQYSLETFLNGQGVVANLLGATERFTILPNSPTDPRYPGVAVAPSENQESGYVRTPAGNVYRT